MSMVGIQKILFSDIFRSTFVLGNRQMLISKINPAETMLLKALCVNSSAITPVSPDIARFIPPRTRESHMSQVTVKHTYVIVCSEIAD